ncbi:MAG: UDP-N-acetylmuramoyl-tripeptide--D-alanyl-D-alanine ligase [Saprospiraceae bacterium]|nr:UDP-N-acetylmuramoyl-tripeptide--D-alanyl-D-alanine ligase [Saprospiraceae bacterium]
MFFALRGANFNGNQFASQALEAGASWVVVDEVVPGLEDERLIKVDNVLFSLQDLARKYRTHLGLPMLAITGSNGKTTTKELLAAVLSRKFKINYTKGNLNNEIGVPLTLLSTSPDTEFIIVEMGANHQGEIGRLCQIALPDFGLITNIGYAHLEGFGGYEGVKKGKSEMYRFLEATNGKIFINASDDVLWSLLHQKENCIPYYPDEFEVTQEFPFLGVRHKSGKTFETHLAGLYNIANIAAAVGVGTYFNMDLDDIFQAISAYIPENNRSQVIYVENVRVIKDAYNANPSSVKLALESLFRSGSEDKVVILGDMLELGDYSEKAHREILEFVLNRKVADAIFVGPEYCRLKEEYAGNFYPDVLSAKSAFDIHQCSGKTVFLKGSRGIALEKLLE